METKSKNAVFGTNLVEQVHPVGQAALMEEYAEQTFHSLAFVRVKQTELAERLATVEIIPNYSLESLLSGFSLFIDPVGVG